jgi:hypothetical protein
MSDTPISKGIGVVSRFEKNSEAVGLEAGIVTVISFLEKLSFLYTSCPR